MYLAGVIEAYLGGIELTKTSLGLVQITSEPLVLYNSASAAVSWDAKVYDSVRFVVSYFAEIALAPCLDI